MWLALLHGNWCWLTWCRSHGGRLVGAHSTAGPSQTQYSAWLWSGQEEAGDGLASQTPYFVDQQPQKFVQKFRCQWIRIHSTMLSQMIMLYMVMIVYATGKLHYFILLVLLLLLCLWRFMIVAANALACNQTWQCASRSGEDCSSLSGSRSMWGKPEMQKELCWTSKVDQWIPLEDLIELISQCILNQLEV